MDQKVNDFMQKINIEFKNPELLQEALTHRSYVNENPDTPNGHNERLEFLGDAVLELATTQMLFNDYPSYPEGDLTSFRAAIVRTESLAEEALKLELGQSLFMSNGEEATGGRDRQYILANAMEALIGSIYLDQGFDVALLFIKEKIYYKVQNIVDNRLDIDAKSKLQELSQEELKITPTYSLVSEEGPDHNKTFTMAVMIGDNSFGEGKGDSKQSAEQVAAQNALENWQELVGKYFPANNA
ncbi:ribonuclease III [Candidatus Dojkabacteria bacterium]|uniref:Ribonuclease 3 n=1 Tax=Candidatus Dojkabacteria bacterium TaxID=2099670 RepID=A0A955I8C6_9BACT|nr:ribonuclease III [Candidatus Dojkabacteria bacterium]